MNGADFIADLLHVVPDDARHHVLRVAERYAGQTVYLPKTDKASRVRSAIVLIDSGHRPREVVSILAERNGISVKQARRYYLAALDQKKERFLKKGHILKKSVPSHEYILSIKTTKGNDHE